MPPSVRRFHAVAELNPERVIKSVGQINDEILANLVAVPGARVRVTIEIEAEFEEGVPSDIQRTVTENSVALKVRSHGFET